VPFLHLAVPLLAGLSAAHALVPPHPGPMAAIELVKADVGKTLAYSLAVGAGAVIISGPMLCHLCSGWKTIEPAGALGTQFVSPHEPEEIKIRIKIKSGNLGTELVSPRQPKGQPGFWPALLTVLLPVLLIMLAAAADLLLRPEQAARKIADAFGTPLGALLVSVLIAFRTLGAACGYDRKTLLKFTEEGLAPVASILLIIGAGGGFGRVMVASGVGGALSELARRAPVSPLIFGWLIAAAIRIATGSATVAIITAAGIVAPVAVATAGLNRELLVIAMGAGSVILSHVNDGGFWLVKEYLGLSMSDTFKSWTLAETVLSVSALALTLALNFLAG